MAFSQTRITALHYGPQNHSAARPDLAFCEALYTLGVRFRLALYQSRVLTPVRLPVPVISVGNLTTGGTGKTPVVIALAQYLEGMGKKVVVLSRGYGGSINTDFHEADSPEYGDEPYLIQQQLRQGKVIVGKNRVYTGERAIKLFQPDAVLMDDGFQHLRLHRDLNILLVDGELGFGNHHLLPAGPLREPLSAIRRADCVLLTKRITTVQEDMLHTLLYSPNVVSRPTVALCPFAVNGIWHPASQEVMSANNFRGKPLLLLSGIAQPQSFEAMVLEHTQGLLLDHLVFPDHHRFSVSSLRPLIRCLQDHPDAVVITTEKDWVKLAEQWPKDSVHRVYVLRIGPVFDWEALVAPLFERAKATHGES